MKDARSRATVSPKRLVWLDGRLAGYVDCDPEVRDGLAAGDVNVSYAVHPWARGRGVAVEAADTHDDGTPGTSSLYLLDL